MSEPFWSAANRGIVGLTEPPWNADEMMDWPTDGYDSYLHGAHWPGIRSHPKGETGHSREEWDALAVEMIARWTAWRTHLAAPPDTYFHPAEQ